MVKFSTRLFNLNVFAQQENFVPLFKGQSSNLLKVIILSCLDIYKRDISCYLLIKFFNFVGFKYYVLRNTFNQSRFLVYLQFVSIISIEQGLLSSLRFRAIIGELCYRKQFYLIILRIVNIISKVLFKGLIYLFYLSIYLQVIAY